jgi:ABC-type nickel/cobalt efflux system permease component RcnA
MGQRPYAEVKDGTTLAFVTGLIPCPLTTFIMSYALARGMLVAGLAVTAAMTVGMIATIGGIALGAAFARDRFMGLLDRTEGWRHRVGTVLEVGGSVMVLVFGLWRSFGHCTILSRWKGYAKTPLRMRITGPTSGACRHLALSRHRYHAE